MYIIIFMILTECKIILAEYNDAQTVYDYNLRVKLKKKQNNYNCNL